MTSTTDFTEREAAIIERLTQRFPDRSVNAGIVNVNRLEGGEEPTLRLTLDDMSSTDFARRRVADAAESVDALAEEAARELENPGMPIGDDDEGERRRRIAERAYAIYEARGGTDGLDEADWLQAERELAAGNPAPVDTGPNVPLASGGHGERAAEVMPDVTPGDERKLPPPGPSQ